MWILSNSWLFESHSLWARPSAIHTSQSFIRLSQALLPRINIEELRSKIFGNRRVNWQPAYFDAHFRSFAARAFDIGWGEFKMKTNSNNIWYDRRERYSITSAYLCEDPQDRLATSAIYRSERHAMVVMESTKKSGWFNLYGATFLIQLW